MGAHRVPIEGVERTAFDWPVVPDGLRELLVGLSDRYGDALPPIYMTENGAALPDVPADDGRVEDPRRIAFLDGHLRALHQAIEAGVDVRGYFVWSLLDNFEWAEGTPSALAWSTSTSPPDGVRPSRRTTGTGS